MHENLDIETTNTKCQSQWQNSLSDLIGPNTGFTFGQSYEYIQLLEHHKRREILHADRSFCVLFYV